MSVDTNNTELKKGADLATIADQRDDQRQQAEAEAAQEVLQRMQGYCSEDEKRRAHEEAEAKRKAEWEQKRREKAEAEQAAWENAVAMGDDEVMMASMKRVGDDAERLTRRNMKQCVTEHIQTKCLSEPEFARQVMHPRKNMIRCFRYITRKAKEFAEQEMKDNDEQPIAGGYGCDVPVICAISGPKNTLWIWTQRKTRKRRKNSFRSPIPESRLLKSKKKADKKKSAPPKGAAGQRTIRTIAHR